MTAATAFASLLDDAIYHAEPWVTIATKTGHICSAEVASVDEFVVILHTAAGYLVVALAEIESVLVSPALVARAAAERDRRSERRLAQRQAVQDAMAGRLGNLVTDRTPTADSHAGVVDGQS